MVRSGLSSRLLVPDAAIGGAGGEGPLGQDDELQQRLPEPRRVVDHPPVGQELVEVAPHRPVVGRVGRAEIGEDHADPRRRHRRMVRRRMGEPALAGLDQRHRVLGHLGVIHGGPVRRQSREGSPGDSRSEARGQPLASPRAAEGAGQRRRDPRSVAPRRARRRAGGGPSPAAAASAGSRAGAQPVRTTISKVARTRPGLGRVALGVDLWPRAGARPRRVGRRSRSTMHVGLAHRPQVAHQGPGEA
jgi:hypothetical protein